MATGPAHPSNAHPEHLPLRESITRERTIGEVLDLLVDAKPRRAPRARHK